MAANHRPKVQKHAVTIRLSDEELAVVEKHIEGLPLERRRGEMLPPKRARILREAAIGFMLAGHP